MAFHNNHVNEVLDNLRKNGYWFWTDEIRSTDAEDAILKKLKETKPQFIEMLETSNPLYIIESAVDANSPIPLNIFIQHVMRATDGSAELLDRVKDYLAFKNISHLHIKYTRNEISLYELKKLGRIPTKLDNRKIMNAKGGLAQDILTLLLFGSQIQEFSHFVSFRKLKLGRLVGNKSEILRYFDSLYLEVSRQARGYSSMVSGSLPEILVEKFLRERFSKSTAVEKIANKRIPGIGRHAVGQQFDLVYAKTRRDGSKVYIAIEIAFQETTNSVIERKGRLAAQLFEKFKMLGYYLCFIIDGAGYFSRITALREIIVNSHMCVTFKPDDLYRLCKFIEAIEIS